VTDVNIGNEESRQNGKLLPSGSLDSLEWQLLPSGSLVAAERQLRPRPSIFIFNIIFLYLIFSEILTRVDRDLASRCGVIPAKC
jgi:hypothetical protein